MGNQPVGSTARLTLYPITNAWVTRPERPKGAKDKVKRPEGPPARSRGLEGHETSTVHICQAWKGLTARQKATLPASAMAGLVNATESNRTFDIVQPAYKI